MNFMLCDLQRWRQQARTQQVTINMINSITPSMTSLMVMPNSCLSQSSDSDSMKKRMMPMMESARKTRPDVRIQSE